MRKFVVCELVVPSGPTYIKLKECVGGYSFSRANKLSLDTMMDQALDTMMDQALDTMMDQALDTMMDQAPCILSSQTDPIVSGL